MMRRITSSVFATTAMMILALTACTDGSGEADAAESPLQKYLSALYDSEEYTQERHDAEQQKIEELVAICMQKEGFEYQPNTQNGTVMVSSEDADQPQFGSLEFAKEYGYGWHNSPGMIEGENSGGWSDDGYVDANADYVASLSESEQQAFYETLYGAASMVEPSDAEAADEPQQIDWSEQGCSGMAYYEVLQESNAAMSAYEDPEFEQLFTEINDLYRQIWDDDAKHEDIAALDTQWVDCMSSAGITDYASSAEASDSFMEQYNALYENTQYGADGVTDPAADPEAYVEPTPAQRREIEQREKEISKREIEVAVADAQCKQQLDYDNKRQKIVHRIEQEFVDTHTTQLDALLAKYAVTDKK